MKKGTYPFELDESRERMSDEYLRVGTLLCFAFKFFDIYWCAFLLEILRSRIWMVLENE